VNPTDVTIRAYQPGDEAAINASFNQVFSLQRPLAEWFWKFPVHPSPRPIVTAWCEGEVVAHNAGVAARFQVDGRVWPAQQSVDTFSLAGARRRTDWRNLWAEVMDDFAYRFGRDAGSPLLYGFPGPRSHRQAVARCGYDALPAQEIRRLERRTVVASKTRRSWLYRAEAARDWEPRLDQLWERVDHRYPVAVIRDAQHALHRFAGHPSIRYHRFLVFPRLGSLPVAWVVFATAGKECRWVDLVWDSEHRGGLELASHLGSRVATQTGADHEAMWLTGDPEASKMLQRMGFSEGPDSGGAAMIVRPMTPSIDIKALDGRVYLTMADADLV